MELNIELETNNNQITVFDISSSYLDENDLTYPLNQFRKSDTQSMIILSVNKTDKEEVLNSSFGNSVKIDKDGWIKVYYLVLPTKRWFTQAIKTAAILERYDIVYFISKGKVYSYQSSTGEYTEVIKLEELLDISKLPNIKTTISIVEKEKVSICNLQKCYINLCQKIFESRGFSQCSNKNNIDSELIYKRDLVWMAINIIKYMTECEQLYEAERIIELMHSCNGICSDNDVKSNIRSNGCGCT